MANYTLRDLIAEPELGLEALSGSAESLNVPLMGAHAIETDLPSHLQDPGWLVLTMGTRLRNKPADQRRLVAELQARGAAALGFGVGLAFKTVPPALLDEAAKRGFPVVLVPADCSFQEISRIVFQSTMSDDAQTYRRLTALQHNLMRAFADADPAMSTLRRLSRFSNSVAAVVTADGTVLATTAGLPFDAIAAAVRERPLSSMPTEVDGWEVIGSPLSTWQSDQPVSLLLASKFSSTSHHLSRTMLDIAVPIFEALGRLTVANRRHDQALSRALLENALAKRLSDVEASQFEEHLAASGILPAEGFSCVVIRDDGGERLDAVDELLQAASTSFPALHTRREDHIVLVVPRRNATVDALRSFVGATRLDDMRAGVGRTLYSGKDLSISQRDALIVLRYLEQENAGCALTFDDLDLASQLLAEVPAERVQAKVEAIIEVLEKQPIQLEAVRAYFDTCLDVQAAARRIYVHPNTLRYRLERFENAVGRSLRDPAMIASLHYVLSVMTRPETQQRQPIASGARKA